MRLFSDGRRRACATVAGWLALSLGLCSARAAGPLPRFQAVSESGGQSLQGGKDLSERLDVSSRRALTDAAKVRGLPEPAQVSHLVDVYQRLLADHSLPAAQRESLLRAVRSRLQRWSVALRQSAGPTTVQGVLPVLAQQLPAGAAPGLAPPADHGPELVELIETTIAPASWDKQGGNGVIRFWAPAHALVVRQSGDVQHDLAGLLKDLGH